MAVLTGKRMGQIWVLISFGFYMQLTPGECFPTITVLTDAEMEDVITEQVPKEMEVTELPPTSLNYSTDQISENDANIAVTEITIIEDTRPEEDFTATSDLPTDDASTTSPTLETIIEQEEESNTASEEFDQSTNNTTQTNGDDIIEPDPDKKEILNELENIWHYTNELGEDQNELKNSLSYLVHMTYARVYEQSDDVLGKLKHRLKILRARLLNQPEISEIEVDPGTTSVPSTFSDIEINLMTEKNESKNYTIESHRNRSNVNKEILHRQKRNDFESIMLATANPDENALFPPDQRNNKRDHLNYFKKTEMNGAEIPKIPQDSRYHSGEAIVQQTINVMNTNNLDDEDTLDNFVHVTIFQPNKRNDTITPIWPFYSTSTMPTPFPLKSTTNTKFQTISPVNVTKLKEKYKLMTSTSEKPQPIENEHENFDWSDEQLSDNVIPAVADIIQSIINVLKTPIPKPNTNDVENPVASLSTKYDPVALENQVNNSSSSYLQKIAEGLGLGEFSATNLDPNFTRVFTISNSSTSMNISKTANSSAESVNVQVVLTPTRILDGTMDQFFNILRTFANMPNAARFVLFFSIAISIVSIALGLYALGPPITAVGVLGIIVPIFFVFLVQSKTGKSKKSQQDILSHLKIEDFMNALDLIADAMIKYEQP